MKYYLDESGNTGDLTKAGANFDFGNQPIFVLAAIGLSNQETFFAEVKTLAIRHKIGLKELKSTRLFSKQGFIADLTTLLQQHDVPFLAEVVEKRYFIGTNLVERLLGFVLPSSHADHRAMMLKNYLADYLGANAPKSVFQAYVSACLQPSIPAIEACLGRIVTWLQSESVDPAFFEIVTQIVTDLEAEISEREGDEELLDHLLPTPDLSKRDKLLWILPNLTCLTNIYARINLRHVRKIEEIEMIHDEQIQFDHILKNGKVDVEQLASVGAAIDLPYADYHFCEAASLEFVGSNTRIGIQVADVLAGFLMRHVKYTLFAPQHVLPIHEHIFQAIMRLTDEHSGTGINFVVTQEHFDRLGIRRAA